MVEPHALLEAKPATGIVQPPDHHVGPRAAEI
jgi:hypothetical protein